MILQLLLPLFTLYHLAESGCPIVCNCTTSEVLCEQRNLETIPSLETLSNDPIIIDLSGNRIEYIGPDDLSFEKTISVKEVYLNNSEVLDIDYEAFDEMENLQELYLGGNLLNSIPENLIEDLPDMVLLDLSNNYFSGEMPIIKSESLEVLALANCKITTITSASLSHLPNLRILLLQQNNIKKIDPKVFASVPNMFFVRLSYNTWECNCETMELFDFLAAKKYVDTSEPYACTTSNGTNVDIYGKEGVEVYRSICSKSEKMSTIHHKRNRYLTQPEDQMKEEDKEDLVLELNDESQKNLEGGAEKMRYRSNEKNLPLRDGTGDVEGEDSDKVSDGEVGSKPYALVKENTTTSDNVLVEKSCGSTGGVLRGMTDGINQFLIAVLTFIVGCLFGFSMNQFLNSIRYRKLETSDSTSKLIGA